MGGSLEGKIQQNQGERPSLPGSLQSLPVTKLNMASVHKRKIFIVQLYYHRAGEGGWARKQDSTLIIGTGGNENTHFVHEIVVCGSFPLECLTKLAFCLPPYTS